MFKMKKKVFFSRTAALLCAAVLLTALAGCGFVEIKYPQNDTTGAPDTTPTPGTTPEAEPTTEPPHTVVYPDRKDDARGALSGLPQIELSVSDLIIANSSAAARVIEPDAGDELNMARTERNKMACEKYNIALTVTSADDSELLRAFINAAAAGTYYADFAVVPAASAALYFGAGIASDLRKLPFYTVPGDPEKADGAGIAGSACYFYCGAAVADPDSMWALYFNRTMAGDQLTDELYSAALGGKFTWEELFGAISRAKVADDAAALLCGGKENSQFAADIACATVGVSFVSHDVGKTPTLNYDAERLGAAGEIIKKLAAVMSTPDEGGTARFAEGRGLFMFGTLSDMRAIYDKKVEWGILPVPSAGADTGYVVPMDENRPVLVCTGGGARTELDGAALAAIDAASGAWLSDAYADAALDSCLRDNNSYLTLRMIVSAEMKFDFAYLFAGATDKLAGATYGAARKMLTDGTDLAAAVKSAKSAVDREISRLF